MGNRHRFSNPFYKPWEWDSATAKVPGSPLSQSQSQSPPLWRAALDKNSLPGDGNGNGNGNGNGHGNGHGNGDRNGSGARAKSKSSKSQSSKSQKSAERSR